MSSPSPWLVTLGHDAAGVEVRRDLSKGPHTLLSGTSGSGKSVGMHALIAGLVESGSPADTQLLILDPKFVEFGMWRAAPHVVAVVTDREQIVLHTQAAVRTMMDRYALLERLGVADIAELEGTRHAMPRLFIVIDELADVVMLSRIKDERIRAANMLGALTRIAQLGRAAGVHLLVATQRPAADTLPGNLRANIGSRWTFRVRTRAESRIGLDQSGAELLDQAPGMSLLSWRGATPTFVQGRYVSREDCRAIAEAASARYGHRRRTRPVGARGSRGGREVWAGLPVAVRGVLACGAALWVAYCVAVVGGR